MIILSTNAGLWGYNIGDTIRFVSINPYRIIVTGRIKHFTSAFGEHVISEEVDTTMIDALQKFKVEVKEFHVAPKVSEVKGESHHEWFVEFVSEPKNLRDFSAYLDSKMQKKNSYYRDLVAGSILAPLKVRSVQKNGFNKYMKSIGKLGGQNKVPRLANDRKIANKLEIKK